MDHIIRSENFLDLVLLQVGLTSLVGEQWREPPVPAAQTISPDVGMFIEADFGVGWMQQMKGIYVMDDVHLVTLITQGMRQAVDVHRIAPEAVRRIKSRQMQKAERSLHPDTTSPIMLII